MNPYDTAAENYQALFKVGNKLPMHTRAPPNPAFQRTTSGGR